MILHNYLKKLFSDLAKFLDIAAKSLFLSTIHKMDLGIYFQRNKYIWLSRV